MTPKQKYLLRFPNEDIESVKQKTIQVIKQNRSNKVDITMYEDNIVVIIDDNTDMGFVLDYDSL